MLTQKPWNTRKNTIQYILIAFIFFSFSLLNTYPLIKHINTHQLGDGGDGPEFMWKIWWIKKSLIELHQSPYYSNYTFYPNGAYHYLDSITVLSGILSIPFRFFSNNMILVYNLVVLVNLILAGMTMFMLAYYFTKNKFASLIAGYVFAFNPYMMGHLLGHLNLISIWPIPLFILYYVKFHFDPSIKHLLFSSLFIILATFGCIYYGIFMLFFSLLYSVFFFITQKSRINFKFILRLCIIFIIYFFILSPIFLGMYESTTSREYNENHNPDFWSPDILTFFMPGKLLKSSFLFNNLILWKNIQKDSQIGAENQNFLGFTLLILSIVGVFLIFKEKSKSNKNDNKLQHFTKFLLLLSLVSFIFALGTKLRFLGKKHSITLPYSYIYKVIPLVSVTGRWVFLIFLSLSLLAAFSINFISKKLTGKKRIFFYSIVFLLIILEFISIPYPSTTYEVSEFYYELAKQKGNFAIWDLSHRDTSDYFRAAGLHMYYQTIHNKKITDGRMSRNHKSTLAYASHGPNINDLELLNIKYVIVPKNSSLISSFKYPIIYEDKELKVFKIF